MQKIFAQLIVRGSIATCTIAGTAFAAPSAPLYLAELKRNHQTISDFLLSRPSRADLENLENKRSWLGIMHMELNVIGRMFEIETGSFKSALAHCQPKKITNLNQLLGLERSLDKLIRSIEVERDLTWQESSLGREVANARRKLMEFLSGAVNSDQMIEELTEFTISCRMISTYSSEVALVEAFIKIRNSIESPVPQNKEPIKEYLRRLRVAFDLLNATIRQVDEATWTCRNTLENPTPSGHQRR